MTFQTFAARYILLFAVFTSPVIFGNELSDRADISSEVATLLSNQNFSKLESIADTYRNNKSRTASGVWHLTIFYSAIDSAFKRSTPDSWARDVALAEKWVSAYPKSATARLAYAQMLSAHGWKIRGSGLASTVRPESWKPFRDHIERARVYLQKYKSIAAVDPDWYDQMATISKIQDLPESDFEKLIDEGLEREPLYYQLYFSAIDYYAPKWGGSTDAIEKFAQSSLQRTRAIEGFGMYARIYWYASQTQYGDALFSASFVDWPTMKKGIDDVLKKYPDDWNTNNFARFACLAGDKVKTAELISKMGDMPMIQVWKWPSDFNDCKQWSAGTMPAGFRPLQPMPYR